MYKFSVTRRHMGIEIMGYERLGAMASSIAP
jgi:hypothetical protein